MDRIIYGKFIINKISAFLIAGQSSLKWQQLMAISYLHDISSDKL